VKLITNSHLVLSQERWRYKVDLYLYSPICLHGIIKVLTMVHNTLNYWVSGFVYRPEFKILENITFRKQIQF
jgi:hypothetical protein